MNDREQRFLESHGYTFAVSANGYSVHHKRVGFVCAAHVAEKTRKTERQAADDIRYNRIAAISCARDRFVSENGDRSPTQHPPPWYLEAVAAGA